MTDSELVSDVFILLQRALLGKKFHAFGEDGCGKFGRNPNPIECRITGLIPQVARSGKTVGGVVALELEGYSRAKHGHMATDLNALIGVRNLLREEAINPLCITWDTNPPNFDADDLVLFTIDVGLLLEWS